ncbi:MAG: hypothetical protein AMXMBFR7_52020 [Planctomycetota bacterium]
MDAFGLVDADDAHGFGGCLVQGSHLVCGSVHQRFIGVALLKGGGYRTDSKRLRKEKDIPGLSAGIAGDAPGMNDPGYRKAEFQFLLVDRMPAHNYSACFHTFLGSASKNLAKRIERKFAKRESHDSQRGKRGSAHRIHIAKGVRCRHLPKSKRIVHYRREKVDGLNQSALGIETKNPRVVERTVSDEESIVLNAWKSAQHLRQIA